LPSKRETTLEDYFFATPCRFSFPLLLDNRQCFKFKNNTTAQFLELTTLYIFNWHDNSLPFKLMQSS